MRRPVTKQKHVELPTTKRSFTLMSQFTINKCTSIGTTNFLSDCLHFPILHSLLISTTHQQPSPPPTNNIHHEKLIFPRIVGIEKIIISFLQNIDKLQICLTAMLKQVLKTFSFVPNPKSIDCEKCRKIYLADSTKSRNSENAKISAGKFSFFHVDSFRDS